MMKINELIIKSQRDGKMIKNEKGQISPYPISEPRKGWDKSFKKMNGNGDDQLIINDVFEDENFEDFE